MVVMRTDRPFLGITRAKKPKICRQTGPGTYSTSLLRGGREVSDGLETRSLPYQSYCSGCAEELTVPELGWYDRIRYLQVERLQNLNGGHPRSVNWIGGRGNGGKEKAISMTVRGD